MGLGQLFRRRPRVTVELLRVRLERFRDLIEANNRVLKLIADGNEKLGGEYLFDSQYLRSLEADLAEAASAAVQDLNEISDNRYPDLAMALARVQRAVRESFGPQRAPANAPLVVGIEEVRSEASDVVGEKMARLGEIHSRIGLATPTGFVITARASRVLLLGPAIAPLLAAVAGGKAAAAPDLRAAISGARMPSEVTRAVQRALKPYDRTAAFAVRSSAIGEDGALSFAGQHATLLNVGREEVLRAWREVVASLFSEQAIAYRRHHGVALETAEMAVGCLLMVRARSSGVIYTIDPAAPEGEALLVTACPGLGVTVVEGRGPVDRFEVSRSPPHRVLRRALADKAEMCIAAPGGGVGMAPVPPEQRRAPAVCDDELAALADAALRIERHMKAPQDIEWALTADGGVQVLQARALQITAPAPERIEELRAARARYRVLMQGSGDVACRGVGIGRVSVVGADETAKGFCPGDVLVSRSASPKLSPLVARASAVVCELGAVTGHLATVARELRVPTLVNVRDATRILVPGTTVTVDADENAIYEGSAEELLRYQLVKGGSFEETAEFRVLRRILKHAAPLYLRDPGASSFAPESCRTYHDIIRFVHERALTELRRVGEVKGCSSDLDLEVPLDLCVVDVGGGTAPERSRGPLRLADVASRPLRAVLEGVLMPGAWATSPADMDLEGFMASATRASPLTMAAVKRNVAIVSSDYLNLNLRLGYHFNVVDAYLGQAGGEDSYVYFRFVGGVTEVSRRARRARLLATILAHYEFRTEQEGELVIGRLQGVGASLCAERLRMIGRLIGFSRQLDIFLRDDAIADKLVSKFLEGGHEVSSAGEEERAMANRTEVLVLDDEPIVGERLKEFLEKKGMSVETFTDSREALGRLGEKQFQVVVTDLKMKGPSGLEVLLEVKNRRLPTEVIVITGYRSIEAAREAECVGAFGFVDKPFRLEALHDLVAKAAKRSRQPRPSELPE